MLYTTLFNFCHLNQCQQILFLPSPTVPAMNVTWVPPMTSSWYGTRVKRTIYNSDIYSDEREGDLFKRPTKRRGRRRRRRRCHSKPFRLQSPHSRFSGGQRQPLWGRIHAGIAAPTRQFWVSRLLPPHPSVLLRSSSRRIWCFPSICAVFVDSSVELLFE